MEHYTYSTDPNDSDTDDDSYSDGDEIAADTDPLDPEDYPSATTIPSPTDTSGFKNGLISGFVLMSLVALAVFIADRRRIRYTG